jgi:hypothetical protein
MATPYTVKSGDTLSAIASRHGMRWQDLYNHPDNAAFRAKRPNPNLIYPGDVIMIPGGAPATPITIEPDDHQRGQTGDLVPSNRGAGGQKHYVSPRVSPLMSIFGSWPFGIQSMSPFVTLKASDSTDFATKFEWEGATPLPGIAHKATVSRSAPGHVRVKIKDKATGAVMDELHVWIVWADISATDATPDTGDKGTFFRVKMGYEFLHDIKPPEIITAVDRPDLSGGNASPVPPAGALNHKGDLLTGGADKKWDSSRKIRKKTINPAGVPLPGDPSFHGNFHNYPSLGDGDGRPGGAGAISFGDLLVVGNDDAGVGDEDNDPYTAPHSGKLWGIDRPSRNIRHADGANGNTVEWRLHFLEFTRLEINGKWYLISNYFPWRVHYKVKKEAGKWKDNGSIKATDNSGF